MGCQDKIKIEFLEMVAAFQKIHGMVKFCGISRSEFVMLQVIFSESSEKMVSGSVIWRHICRFLPRQFPV